MRRPHWVNRKTVIAATALLGGAALLAPFGYRTTVTGLIDLSLESRFGATVNCAIDPEDTETHWLDTNPDRLCLIDAEEMRLSGTVEDPFMAAGYVGDSWGATVTVFGNSTSPSMPIHERAHRTQGTLELTTTADRVVFRTFRESDARLAVIIGAYRDLLSTGDRTLWKDVNARYPEMLRVFDTLLISDPASRESLAEGGLPSVRIMRQTAMAYLFSQNSRNYLENNYVHDYPNMAQTLALGNITIHPADLSDALQREGVSYLFVKSQGRQNNPLNRWVLYDTLGVGLSDAERPVENTYRLQEAELRSAIETAEAREEVAELTARHEQVCRRSPEALAYMAAGLDRFRGQLAFASMQEPLHGIELLPDPSPPAPVAPPAPSAVHARPTPAPIATRAAESQGPQC